MERLPELQLVVLRHWSSHPPPQLGLRTRQSIGDLALGVETHWDIHEHTNVLDLWDVNGFMRFLKQWRLSEYLSWGLGPFPDWRTSRNMTMALVTRPVRTFRRRPHYTTFWKEVCKECSLLET